MHPNPCLVEGTLSEAIEALAQRAVVIRYGAPRLEKSAMDKTAVLEGLGKWWGGLDPTAKGALLGGGAGAALGAGSSLLGDDEEKHPWSSGLTGGLAGAAVGAGLGLAGRNAPVTPSSPAPALTHPGTGQAIRVKPGVTPEQAKRLEDLQSKAKPGVAGEWAGKGIWHGLKSPWFSPSGEAVAPLTTTGLIGKLIHGATTGRYHVDPSRSGNVGHAQKGLADSLSKMSITPEKPGSPMKPGTETVTQRPRIDPASGNVMTDASGEILRDTVRTRVPDTPAGAPTPAQLSNSSALKGVKSVQEYEALRRLGDWANRDPMRAREFLQHGDITQLRPELQTQFAGLRPETIRDLQRHGAGLDVGKTVADANGSSLLRRARAYDMAQSGWLNRLTGGRARRLNFEPHVNMSRWSGKARTAGKYALPALLGGLGESYAWDLARRTSANNQYQQALSELTEPAK